MAVDSTHAVLVQPQPRQRLGRRALRRASVYESNQLLQAEHLLNVYLPLARADVGLPDHMILSH